MSKLQFLLAWLLILAKCQCYESDTVNEKLTLQPLQDGSFLFVLDVDIITPRHVRSEEHMAYPGIMMDVMAPDLAKLFWKTHVEKFEATQHMGDWHDTWGCSNFDIFNHGESLWATWLPKYTQLEAYDFFETLATSLWGITGSQFHYLASRDVFVFDVNRIATLEEPTPSQPKERSLAASYSEDIFCVDNLYKWRVMMPSLAQAGLLSLINDERVWSRSPYKGVRSRMFMEASKLKFTAQFQLVVNRNWLKKGIWSIYRERKVPKKLLDATTSTVEFIVPEQLRGSFEGNDRLVFDFLDLESHSLIESAFMKLFALSGDNIAYPCTPRLSFRVSELESSSLSVQRRVESSLSVLIDNPENSDKYVKLVQPLPYWMLPQISTLIFTISHEDTSDGVDQSRIVTYSCVGSDCFKRLVHRERLLEYVSSQTTTRDINIDLDEDLAAPLMVYDHTEYWIGFGFSVKLPSNSRLECRVDLHKNKLTFEEIDYSMHRGQLIHSGMLIESSHPTFDNLTNLKGKIHYTGPFFSHIILPDNTMAFNVMAAVGVIIGLLFSLVFNLATRKLPLSDVTEPKKTD
ncbi:uncharacterized protein BXIN_1295 [Babesia sp. Xinjiang]|uniref:uncharacterized protein n=1 Tax=Babesia sp. Xinjiang TaxID=462227 RepID=UPI000A237B8F|nr:uncharacterized protein BXIN_1295 [Babesia sp. Xinjiang]ORM39901.1 hypothetical protein BXIN_1295 [Babesia sp. Xinjiang]